MPTRTASVTCVIPCKGRLASVKKSIAALLGQQCELRILVVDYGCPQQTLDWCREHGSPALDCVKVQDRTETFNLSRARNSGNRIAQSDLIIALDADCLLKSPRMVQRMLSPILRRRGVSSIARVTEWDGTSFPGHSYMAYRRSDWLAVRGYDEAMVGWGFEDTDFYMRMRSLGCCRNVCTDYAEFERLQHRNADRHRFYRERDLDRSWRRNRDHAARRTVVNPRGFAGFRYEYFRGDTGQTTFGRFPRFVSR